MATLSVGGTTVFDGAELQSGVTGSPVLTLPSTTTFPAGHVLQIQTSHLKDLWGYTNTTTWDWGTASTRADQSHGSIIDDLSLTLTAKGTNSDFYIKVLN